VTFVEFLILLVLALVLGAVLLALVGVLLGAAQAERRAVEAHTLKLREQDRELQHLLFSVFSQFRDQDRDQAKWTLAASSEFFQHQSLVQAQSLFGLLQLLMQQFTEPSAPKSDPDPDLEFPQSPDPDPELPE
jgi:hypothetical protein